MTAIESRNTRSLSPTVSTSIPFSSEFVDVPPHVTALPKLTAKTGEIKNTRVFGNLPNSPGSLLPLDCVQKTTDVLYDIGGNHVIVVRLQVACDEFRHSCPYFIGSN